MTGVLTALGNQWDSRIATLLEGSREVSIVRRCADLPDLMATAAAGLGTAALVSADLRGLDLSAVSELRAHGVVVVGVISDGEGPGGDEVAERRMRQLGVTRVVPGGADLAAFERALTGTGGRGAGVASDHSDTDGLGGLGGLGGLAGLGGLDGIPGITDLDGLETAAGDEGAGAPRPRSSGPSGATGDEHGAAGTMPARASGHGHPAGEPEEADAPEPGRIVAVWGPAGSPGRTTVAVTLASELAVLGVPTLLVDADTYGGSVAQALSFLDEAPGVAAASRAADQGTLDLAMLARLAPLAAPGLRVLTGIPKAERWTEIRAPALERVLALSRGLAQVVVVDCGFNLEDDEELSYDTMAPRRNAATLTALSLADEVVAVGGCDPVSLQRLVRGLQELSTLPSPPPVVVVNRVRAGAVGPKPEARVSEALARFAGVEGVLFVPDDPASLDTALLQGRALCECAPQSPVRAAVRALASRVAQVSVPARHRGRHLLRR